MADKTSPATLPIDALTEFDPNPRDDIGDVSGLTETIRLHGIVEPLVVVPSNGGYTVLSGHRRLAAARDAGLTEVPVAIRDAAPADWTTVALITNTQRVDLTPVEEGRAYQALIAEHGWTQRELAANVGRSQAHVSKRMRLLNPPAPAVHERTVVPVDTAAALIRRLANRGNGNGLHLSDHECEALITLLKRAADALRAAADAEGRLRP